MINSVNALSANYEINKYNNNYNFYNSLEFVNKEADEDAEQDQGSTLSDEDKAKIATTKAMVDYLKTGLSAKYEQIVQKVNSKKNSGTSSSATSTNTTNRAATSTVSGTNIGTSNSLGATTLDTGLTADELANADIDALMGTDADSDDATTQPTEQQLKVKAQAQTLIQKLLGDSTISRKYNNFMNKYYGTGTATTGSTGSGETGSTGSTGIKTGISEELSSFISAQLSILSKSAFASYLKVKTPTTTEAKQPQTATETTSAQINDLVNKVKI